MKDINAEKKINFKRLTTESEMLAANTEILSTRTDGLITKAKILSEINSIELVADNKYWNWLGAIDPMFISNLINLPLCVLYAIFGISVPTFVPILGLVVASLLCISYGFMSKKKNDDYIFRVGGKASFLNSALKVLLSFSEVVFSYCLNSLVIPYFYFSALPNIALFAGIQYIFLKSFKLINNKDKSFKAILFDLIPAIIGLIGVIVFSDVLGLISCIVGYDKLKILSIFSFVVLINTDMYRIKDNKFMLGTFDLEKFPKYLLGFFLQATLVVCLYVDSSVIALLSGLPAIAYASYILALVPLVFNQTLLEELISRSIVLRGKDNSGCYDTRYIFLSLLFIFIFALAHFSYFEFSFMGFMLCMSNFLPISIAWMLICDISGGVEYSSGIHFANNLVLFILNPLSVINGGFAVSSICWGLIGSSFIESSLMALAVFVPILIIEKFFVMKNSAKSLEELDSFKPIQAEKLKQYNINAKSKVITDKGLKGIQDVHSDRGAYCSNIV